MPDIDTWLLDVGYDRIFRVLIRRRPGDWTPYETANKFIDQSRYETDSYMFARIAEAIELPDGDVLLGLKEISEDEDFEKAWTSYYKLSEIVISYNPADEERF